MIDPRIPLMGNAPPSFDIGGTLGKIAQIKRMEAISQQEQQEMAIRQREQQEKDQITAVLRETQGDLTTAIPRIRQINPLVAAKIETTMTDAQEAKVKLAKARLDHDLNAAEFISRQLNGVTDQQTYDYARAAIGGAGLPTQQMNPQFDPGYVESLKAKGMSVKEELDLKKSEIDRLFQERKFQAEQQNVSADNTRADTAEARQAARDAQQATVEGARLGLERQRVGLEGQRVALARQEANKPAGADGATGVKLSAGQQQELETMLTLSDMANDVLALGNEIGWSGVGAGVHIPLIGKVGVGSASEFASKFGAGTDKERTLRNKIANITGTLAKLRGGSALTPQELAMIERYTPTINDGDADIQQKLRDLIEFVETKRQNTIRVASGDLSGGASTRAAAPTAAATPSYRFDPKTGKLTKVQ